MYHLTILLLVREENLDFFKPVMDSVQDKDELLPSSDYQEHVEAEIGTPSVVNTKQKHVHNVNTAVNGVTIKKVHNHDDMLVSIVCHINRPAVELYKSDGKPIEFHKLIRQFNTRVVAYFESYKEMLNFLEQYTIGKARDIVIGYSYLKDAEEAYK